MTDTTGDGPTEEATLALGVILPSSNRVVERATEARLAGLPAAACYARVPYGAMLKGEAYDESVFLTAADLLADAGVAALCWNATRGAALGFTPDEDLCATVTRRTGLPMVTTALAARARIRESGYRRVGLVVQGGPEEAEWVGARFAQAGIAIGATCTLGITENRLAAAVSPARLEEAARMTAQGSDAVLIWSTNLPGWRLPALLDGVPLLDATGSAQRRCWRKRGCRAPDANPSWPPDGAPRGSPVLGSSPRPERGVRGGNGTGAAAPARLRASIFGLRSQQAAPMSLITYLTRIQFERGAVRLIGEELALLGARRPLVVTDRGVVAAGLIARVLDAAGLPATTPVFDGTPRTRPRRRRWRPRPLQGGRLRFGDRGRRRLAARSRQGVALLATHDEPLALTPPSSAASRASAPTSPR